MHWKSVPRLWPDSTVFIIGGGPSVNSTDLSLIHSHRVIGVNNAYGDPIHDESGKLVGMLPRAWVDICWFGDNGWWNQHHEFMRKFPNLIASCATNNNIRYRVHRVKCVDRGKAGGIEKEPWHISWNNCSGTAAINLAYHLGATRVVLIGYDMRVIDPVWQGKDLVSGQKNYHSDHSENLHNPFPRYLLKYPTVAKDAKELGLEILNATPGSAIKQFPFVRLEDVV